MLRERLQKRVEGFSFAISSMNDFPIPEDPPVITTAVYSLRASLSWSNAVGVTIQDPGVRGREKSLKGESKKGWLPLLEIRFSARNSWLLTPSVLTPIELLRLCEDKRKEEARLFSASQPNNIGSYE
jgi:hypothetical protein